MIVLQQGRDFRNFRFQPLEKIHQQTQLHDQIGHRFKDHVGQQFVLQAHHLLEQVFLPLVPHGGVEGDVDAPAELHDVHQPLPAFRFFRLDVEVGVQADVGGDGFENFEDVDDFGILRGLAAGQVDLMLGEGVQHFHLFDFVRHQLRLGGGQVPVGFRHLHERFVDVAEGALVLQVTTATDLDKNTEHNENVPKGWFPPIIPFRVPYGEFETTNFKGEAGETGRPELPQGHVAEGDGLAGAVERVL